MKITELKNAPDWLKIASVSNENVDIVDGLVIWQNGEWRGGVWQNGVWRGGMWQNGKSAMKSKYIPLVNGDYIYVGCKSMSPDEWIDWLDSDDEFETERGTPEFRMIEAHIRAAIEYCRVMKK